MSRIYNILVLALILVPAASRAQRARDALDAGAKEFESGAFDKAAAQFEEAAALAAEQKLDPAVAHYNRGNALYKMQDFAGADQAYQNALRTTDLNLAPDGYYNRGNALAAQALQLEQQQQLKESIGLLDQALAMYEKSMLLNPGKPAAKTNYELVTLKKKELEQQQKQQQEQQQKQDQKKEEQKNDQQQQQEQQQKDQQEQEQDKQDQQQQPREQQAEEQKQQPQPRKSDEMSKEEAEMMLDAMKNDEQNQREQIQMILGRPQPVDKDW